MECTDMNILLLSVLLFHITKTYSLSQALHDASPMVNPSQGNEIGYQEFYLPRQGTSDPKFQFMKRSGFLDNTEMSHQRHQLTALSETNISQKEKKQNNKSARNKGTKSKEVSWRDCSAKNVKVGLDSNVKLRCEAWAPLGSSITWSKNNVTIRSHEHAISFENKMKANAISSNEVLLQNNDENGAGRSMYEFHLRSVYFLDCMSVEDEGTYKIHITTPKKEYTRSFNVKSVGTSNRYAAYYCTKALNRQFDLRITEFAKTVIGKRGKELVLPCRSKVSPITGVNWNQIDRKITAENYTIIETGDLKIHKLSDDDKGMFVCEVYNCDNDITYDQITTFVDVQD